MKIYEKPMAIVNKFEVEDVIAASVTVLDAAEVQAITGVASQGVMFQW